MPAKRTNLPATPTDKTYVGIDFGTSTTVVSIARVNPGEKELLTEKVWIEQLLEDGITESSSWIIPSVLAWYRKNLLVGQGAANLRHQLTHGRNCWSSFKMELGEDLGYQYYNSELEGGHPLATILTPVDAAALFFTFLRKGIENYCSKNQLPGKISYTVSIPASFESNQRKDLLKALEESGIEVEGAALVDEPNAAFLGYLATNKREKQEEIFLPGDYPLHVLVFDFGAGTCDISILELARRVDGIHSSNLSISRFEKLGGDNIDRDIAEGILLKSLLSQNGIKKGQLRTAVIRKAILPRLLGYAEQLKIKACDVMERYYSGVSGQSEISLDGTISIKVDFSIQVPGAELTCTEFAMNLGQFQRIMKPYLNVAKGKAATRLSIFKPVESALQKAGLKKDDIDIVLLIGGSCENPTVRDALAKYFSGSRILIPADLRSNVSRGAAIHCLVKGYTGASIIKPITSEPIIVVTKNEVPHIIIPAGTKIPSEERTIDNLVIHEGLDNYLEIPICVGDVSRLVHLVKARIPSRGSIAPGTPVKLVCSVRPDKLLKFEAYLEDKKLTTVSINPFSSQRLPKEEEAILHAEREVNNEAAANSGRPGYAALVKLADAYQNAGKYLLESETLVLAQELNPSRNLENRIGIAYGNAGQYEKSLLWFERAHEVNPSALTAFNLAVSIFWNDIERYKRLMEQAIAMDSSFPYSLHHYGKYLNGAGDERGEPMVKQAFDLFMSRHEMGVLSVNDHSRVVDCALFLGRKDVAAKFRKVPVKGRKEGLWDGNNLLAIDERNLKLSKVDKS